MNRTSITMSAVPIEFHKNTTLDSYKKFVDKFKDWIYSTENKIDGLPSNYYITSGVTDALNQTYGLYNKIGVFEGEYGYHELVAKNKLVYDFDEADVIILSHPFSANGMCNKEKLEYANSFNKPIFVDCAFFGICSSDISFDFTQYKNIESVSFSLSKTFGTGWHRVGLLFTENKNYPAALYTGWYYDFISSAEAHYDIIDNLTPNCTYKKYKGLQVEICKELELTPSDTVIFGLDYTNKYNEFKRGDVNRVCISNLIRERHVQS